MQNSTYADRVREARQTKGLTLEQAARLLGISTTTLLRIENATTTRPHARVAHQIQSVLGVTPDQAHQEVG